MSRSLSRITALPLLLLGMVCLGGCLPSSHSQLDEQKEYHYLAGKSRVTSLDFKGAIVSFEKALEANPQSASAHYELGVLFDQKASDPAAAVYHYSRYLKLRPDAQNADMITNRMTACKQELASTVSLGPVTRMLEKELQKAIEENNSLKAQLSALQTSYDTLRAQAATTMRQAPDAASPSVHPVGTQAPQSFSRAPSQGVTVAVITQSRTNTTGSTPPQTRTPRTTRSHTVQSGETMQSIAKKYGVRVTDLSAANPRVEPKRMKVGQPIVIP